MRNKKINGGGACKHAILNILDAHNSFPQLLQQLSIKKRYSNSPQELVWEGVFLTSVIEDSSKAKNRSRSVRETSPDYLAIVQHFFMYLPRVTCGYLRKPFFKLAPLIHTIRPLHKTHDHYIKLPQRCDDSSASPAPLQPSKALRHCPSICKPSSPTSGAPTRRRSTKKCAPSSKPSPTRSVR